LSYLDPRVNLLRALALSAVTGALMLLTATSLWRLTFRLQYEWWRIVHGSLAAFILVIAVVHPLQVGHYVSGPVKQIMVAGFGLIGIALLGNTRLVRPARMKRRPYRVKAVREERAGAATLVLTPEGHSGIRFRPGQFA